MMFQRRLLHKLQQPDSMRFLRHTLPPQARRHLATLLSRQPGSGAGRSELRQFARQISAKSSVSGPSAAVAAASSLRGAGAGAQGTASAAAADILPLFSASAQSVRLWLAGKAPKGFGNFVPKGKSGPSGDAAKQGAKDASKAGRSEASKASSKAEKSKVSEKFGTQGGGGGGGGDPKNEIPPLGQIGSTVALLLGASLMYSLFSGGEHDAQEISWQELKNRYLAAGQVERVVVMNKTMAKVTLRPAGGAGEDDAWGSQDMMMDSQGSSGSWEQREAEMRQRAREATMNGGRRQAHVYFAIGSIENFERKLENAQRELGIASRDFVPVQYVNQVDWKQTLLRLSPTLLLVALWIFMMRGMASGMGGMGGGGGGGMSNIFKIGKAKPATKASTADIKFKDVAGCDEAKAEIMEFVSFLKSPERFVRLGAKIPKGALLVGPPGTGKTLLAKATAGEASVPFFSMSGSDFIEMFVGVGPSRVRDLFKKARESAPCIIFIDEIDAVARARSKGGFSGGNDERENTLNQLLVEMDGFTTKEGVVVLAGTNRADILDKAILRPGRFDRQIMVDKPDIKGRKEIFEIYLNNLVVDGDTTNYAERLAALTPGFAGAEIANICNEAAIIAARAEKESVELVDFESACDRVIGGLPKADKVMSPEEKATVAYHEAGHAIVGWLLEHADPLLKVTIVPRSNGALGFAQYLPKELSLHSTEQLRDMICMALGGRAAEDAFFGKVTTGASDDLRRVTGMAHSMVSIYGMSDKIGQVSYPPDENQQFGASKPYSEATAQVIDSEVKGLVDEMYSRTLNIVEENKDKVEALAELLLKKETINVDDVVATIGPRPFPMPLNYSDFIRSAWKPGGEEAAGEDAEEVAGAVAEDGDDGSGGATPNLGGLAAAMRGGLPNARDSGL